MHIIVLITVQIFFSYSFFYLKPSDFLEAYITSILYLLNDEEKRESGDFEPNYKWFAFFYTLLLSLMSFCLGGVTSKVITCLF